MENAVLADFVVLRGVSDEELRANIRANSSRGISEVIPQGCSGPIQIVGGGPSLEQTWREIRTDWPIMALNGAYRFLMDRDITPKYSMVLDSMGENVRFFIIASMRTTYLINARVHPGVLNRLEDLSDVRLWYSMGDIEKEMFGNQKTLVNGGSTVAISALPMAYHMGYREFHYFGFDSCVSESGAHHAYPQEWNEGKDTQPYKVGEKWFECEGWMAAQSADFNAYLKWLVSHGDGVDCVHIHGGGLCAAVLEEFKAQQKQMAERVIRRAGMSLTERERDKYREMWERPEYREWSPADKAVKSFFTHLEPGKGNSIWDYGCGAGQAVEYFSSRGLDATGCDFAENARVGDFPFVPVCLWEMHRHPVSDWAFCCDVMEHIPPDKVDDVLWRIAQRTKKGAFFQIATVPDVMGRLIGETLHLSVHDADWWWEKMDARWPDIEMKVDENHVRFYCRRAPGGN